MPVNPSQNFLSDKGFRFILERTPNVQYFTQEVSLPSISLGGVESVMPFHRHQRHGSKLTWSPLVLNFAVDENLINYKEIHNWMFGLAPATPSESNTILNDKGPVSDGTLFILNSNHSDGLQITFENLWPTDLSELSFSSTSGDLRYLKATVTFEYMQYTFKE